MTKTPDRPIKHWKFPDDELDAQSEYADELWEVTCAVCCEELEERVPAGGHSLIWFANAHLNEPGIKLVDLIGRTIYSAFCQQWIAVAWAMLIGRE